MLRFQRYIFYDTIRTLLIIIATLSVLSLLAQGLAYTEIIRENQQSITIYLKIISLGAPKVIALLFPITLFVAAIWTINRVQKDAEIMVVRATGMTDWQLASPVIRIAIILVIAHLALNLWGQPAAQRELRETLLDARTDLATTIIKQGQFTSNGNLTFYTTEKNGPNLKDLYISDASDPAAIVDYFARSARFAIVDGAPAFIMTDAQSLQIDQYGQLSRLDLDQYKFDLRALATEETDTVLKASDRYLPELIWLDPTNYVDAQSKDQFTAEIHNRLTTPLLNIAMALLAISAILGGDYSKLGYGRRIAKASVFAALLIILHIVAHSEAKNDPALNALQWLLPLSVICVLSFLFFIKPSFKRLEFLTLRRRFS